MKRFLYSSYTKIVAAVLFVVFIVSGALVVCDGISRYLDLDEGVYNFERDFSESRFITGWMNSAEYIVYNAFEVFYTVDDETETVTSGRPLTVNGMTLEQHIEQELNALNSNDRINYYIKINDSVFTNCGATTPEELMQGDFYSYVDRQNYGNVERHKQPSHDIYPGFFIEEIARYDDKTTITMATTIKDEVIEEYEIIWNEQKSIVTDTFTIALVLLILSLILLIYLICVCGKNKDGELKTIWVDNIWAEIHLAAIGGALIVAIGTCAIILDNLQTGRFPYDLTMVVVGAVATLASIICLNSLLSIIRNIKNKRFVETSIIARIVKWCWKTFVKVIVWLRNAFVGYRSIMVKTLHKKTGALLIGTLFGYTVLIGLFGIFTCGAGSPFWIFVGIALFVGASFLVAHRSKDIDEIKKGVSEIRNYNSGYKIPELKCEDLKELAVNINEIGNSIDESVAAKMKAERMKTELITNVSHDLKTPLTSIINYTEHLSNVEGLPEEAQDYIKVIAKKSERLKNLTQDLFDISKAQSGNEEIIFEKLDAELLVNQSIAEHDKEIENSGLTFCTDVAKDLYFPADGRKMSRVINNLISNMLKYSLKNTRTFIKGYEKDGQIVLEFKNTSAYPLDFDAEEIMGRFVRGDEARTTEGSGLGLAIAKSYTELCNGTLEIVLDGDLFKAILKFKKY